MTYYFNCVYRYAKCFQLNLLFTDINRNSSSFDVVGSTSSAIVQVATKKTLYILKYSQTCQQIIPPLGTPNLSPLLTGFVLKTCNWDFKMVVAVGWSLLVGGNKLRLECELFLIVTVSLSSGKDEKSKMSGLGRPGWG